MSIIFHRYFGPFTKTTFAIFSPSETSFRLSWDEGDEYDVVALVNEHLTVFKFLPGTIAELKVSSLSNRLFKFEGAQIPGFPIEDQNGLNVLSSSVVLDAECVSINCAFSWPCPDPTTPELKCDEGDYECHKSQG